MVPYDVGSGVRGGETVFEHGWFTDGSRFNPGFHRDGVEESLSKALNPYEQIGALNGFH